MEKCLLSVDWDYFIYTQYNSGSYTEDRRSLIDGWYKRYIQARVRGEDIQKAFKLSPKQGSFWARIRRHFRFTPDVKTYVSDSHALSYAIAKKHYCRAVYLFDAHADLGYGGLSALSFEVNCSNWLGKLLKEELIREANIFYSPFTSEKPDYFMAINNLYNIRYCDFRYLNGKCITAAVVHICRSGAWTPPWLDEYFYDFVKALGLPYEIVDCPPSNWDPEHLSLSDQIRYLMA